ncbi:MAG: methyltransferase [Flavobacteriaceae bacterium]|nr:methyltransferase [Flavobacteriaceae bacterium]
MKPFAVIDHLVSKSSFDLVLDKETMALKTIPELSGVELEKYYPKTGYASHETQANSFKSKIYSWVKRRNIKSKLNWIHQYATKGQILDYGAGNGDFALAAQQEGWRVCVYESSPSATETLKHRQLSTASMPLKENQFDVITLWHVFEHINKPDEALASFYKSLKPGGILVLAVPNCASWDAKHYKTFWAAYDVPRHRWHYNKQAISFLVRKAGFELFKTKNMYWDAFYISMLSEQYQNAKAPWIKAFYKGLYANFKGWRTTNTSSLTFFLQKPK